MAAVEEVACATCGLLPGGEASGAADVCTCPVEVVDAEVVPESTELVVVDRISGESLTLRDAEDDALALFMVNAEEWKRRQAAEVNAAIGLVNTELIRRMDARAGWTFRTGILSTPAGGRVQFEVKTSSPTAGTEAYDVDRLEEQLKPLVEAGVIAQELFEEAVKRTVVVKTTSHATRRLESLAKEIGASVDVSRAVNLPTIKNKLKKLPDERIAAALEAARVEARISHADRKVQVKPKTNKKG